MTSFLKVQPEEISFEDVKAGVLYVMTFSVRNTSTVAQRIRLQAPKSSFYALNYIPAGPIAPGLDLRAEIEFQIPPDISALVFRDLVVATMGQERVEIPLRAVRPHPVVKFDSVINLGNVLLNQSVVRDLVFHNVSDLNTTVVLAPPRDASLQLSVSRLELKAGQKSSIKVNISPKVLGPIRELIKIKIGGAIEDFQIDFSGKVIEQSLMLLSENKQGMLDVVDFGDMFYGEKKGRVPLLVNPSPFPLSFSIKYEDDDETNGIAPVEGDPYTKQIGMSPLDGIVRPFSELPLSLFFAPVLLPPPKGFEHENNKALFDPRPIARTIRIECLDNNQVIALQVGGKAVAPLLHITPSSLRFGECPVNDRRDVLLTLTNQSKLPIHYAFPAVAQFKFTPSKSTLPPSSSASVIASFIPAQLGVFKQKLDVSVCQGLGHVKIVMFGESTQSGLKKTLIGGTDKLPMDFEKQLKFVDSDVLKQARVEQLKVADTEALEIEGKVRTLMGKTGLVELTSSVDMNENKMDDALVQQSSLINPSEDRDEIYNLDKTDGQDRPNNSRAGEKRAEFEERRAHNTKYNTYLKQSHAERELKSLAYTRLRALDKGAIDFADPYGVNLGMDRGLQEPNLPLPPVTEPLYLLSNTLNNQGAGGVAKLQVDENRLMQKKYKNVASTQAEVRDVSMELTIEQLKSIVASHKVIDFGRVNVGSLTPKNFAIQNSLKQSILASVSDLDIELQQSKHLTQIIPEGCIAGFDIYFSSRVVGKVKKSFTYKINGIHTFKVHVQAEVVPIELVMNKKEVIMEFAQDYLKPTLSTDVVLSNPGNAYADFLWGSAGAFTVDPEKGSLPPGKSTVISLTWNPWGGKRQEEEIGLHVTGGADQTLLVKGLLKEAKGEFSVKRIALGVMAVGTEKEIVNNITNTGEHPLVFFVNTLDESLGIKIEPTEACVLPNESCEIIIKITPKYVMSYDNVSITARVRGGKNVNCKLSGSSIIPDLDFMQSSLHFGNVTVGSNARQEVGIVNRSPIAATLVLDMTSFPEFYPRLLAPIEPMDIICKEFGDVISQQEDEVGNRVSLIQGSKKSSKKKAVDNTWKIIIQPNTQLMAELVFRPSNSRRHSFKLPLHLLGMDQDKKLMRDVSAIGVGSVLSVSSFVVNFNDRVVSRDPLARSSYFMESVITNTSSHGVSFAIKESEEVCESFESTNTLGNDHPVDPLADKIQIFFISPLKADLPPGGSVKLRVTFQPQENGLYYKKLPIMLKNKDEKEGTDPYLTMIAMGSGVYPRITFSTQSLQLPTVPLGYVSRAYFTLYNNGYNALEVRHRISPNISAPLEVSYPDGNQLGIMIEQIRVMVSYKSDAPMSWQGKIEFYDNDGERFFINLSGCTDNCLLTNYPFVRDYHEEFGFIGLDDQPVQFLSVQQMNEMKATEAKRKEELRKQRSLERQRAVEGGGSHAKVQDPASTDIKSPLKKKNSVLGRKNSDLMRVSEQEKPSYPDGIDIEKALADKASVQRYVRTEAAFLLKWLNVNVCRKPFDTEKYPHCIVDSTGDLVIDCIEQMSGKKLTNLKPAESGRASRGNANNVDKDGGGSHPGGEKRASERSRKISMVDKMVYKVQQVLNFLISHGALLGHMNPIYLLNKDESILMLEYELMKEKSVRVTPALLASRHELWEQEWLEKCEAGWLEVLYQAVKVFVLARCNYKEYSKLPGVVLSTKSENLLLSSTQATGAGDGNEKAVDKKKKKKVPLYPKEFEQSNVFTHNEQVLLAWCTYHTQHADNCKDYGVDESAQHAHDISRLIAFNKRIVDFSLGSHDFFTFCQLLHSHVPDLTHKGGLLYGYTGVDRGSMQDSLFEMFEESSQEYKVALEPFRADEVMMSGRSVLMLCLHLYLQLPHLIPKAKIEFTGLLGNIIQKKIELKNGAKKPLYYKLTLKGSEDYNCEVNDITIPAESNADVLVTCNPRFMHPVQGKLYCWNVREGGYAVGATLCFEFVSSIKGIKPRDVIHRTVNMYDLETFSISVKNTYNMEGDFKVRLQVRYCEKKIDSYIHPPEDKSVKRSSSPQKGEQFKEIPLEKPTENAFLFDSNDAASSDDWDIENMVIQPFWIVEDHLTVPRYGSKNFTVYMLPFVLGKYQCDLVFVEKELGEFSYAFHVDVGLPRSSDRLEYSAMQNKKVKLQLTLNSKNPLFEKAYSVVTEQRIKNTNKKIRARQILFNMASSKVVSEDGGSDFHIDFLPAFVECKKNLLLVSEYMKWPTSSANNASKARKSNKNSIEVIEGNGDGIEGSANCAVLTFFPEKAGVYRSMAVIYSKDNHRDVRCIECHMISKVGDSKLLIEFNGTARRSIVQEIPISNETDTQWNLSVGLTNALFSTSTKTLSIPPHETGILEVTFYNVNEGRQDGKLLLKNTETMDSFEYTLVGNADEPLAEDSLKFSCTARSKTACTISLPSIEHICGKRKDKLVLSVETDIQYLYCEPTHTMYAESPGSNNFAFSLVVPMGGSIKGSVTFRDQEGGSMLWYAISVDISSPSEERSVVVECEVRKAAVVDILLENTLENDLVFDVFIEGGATLMGDRQYSLPSNSSGVAATPYELIYSPILPGNYIGKVSFFNEVVGEIWYKLILKALPAPPVDVGVVEAMLGGVSSVTVSLDNPLGESVTVNTEVEDSEHFGVQPSKIVLSPYLQTTFQITFRPSSIAEYMHSTVKLHSKQLGEMLYTVQGVGLLPGVMDTVYIEGQVNEMSSQSVVFRNPFPHPLPLDVILSAAPPPEEEAHSSKDQENNSNASAFSLLVRKASDIVIGPKSSYHVPIAFAPSKLAYFSSTLLVRSSVNGRQLLWCYPIVGVPEAGPAVVMGKLQAKSKGTLMKEQIIALNGLSAADYEGKAKQLKLSDFSINMDMEEDVKNLVLRTFRVQALDLIRLNGSEANIVGDHQADFGLRCRLLFEPLRIFSASVQVDISHKRLGKWKTKIDLDSLDPEPDDTIKLVAKVKEVDRVSFKLVNQFLGYSPFQAYFSSSSSPHFSVYPMTGALPPYDANEGMTFTVSYAPKEYGVIEQGLLIILTEDAQWSYAVKGSYPENTFNQIKSKVDNKRAVPT